MSQAGILNVSNSPSPPDVPTEFETQSGTAVPLANILIVDAFDTNENNDNGITVKGGAAAGDPPGTGNSNEVTIYLTNRLTGNVQTTNATPTVLLTVPLGATPGVYLVQGDITAYNVTDATGSSYTFIGAAITDGIVGTEIAVENKNVFEPASMAAVDFDLTVVGNDAVITVVGLSTPDKTINWSCLFTYRFQG